MTWALPPAERAPPEGAAPRPARSKPLLWPCIGTEPGAEVSWLCGSRPRSGSPTGRVTAVSQAAASSRRAATSFRSGSRCRGGNGNGPTVVGAHDPARGDESREDLAEPLVAHAHLVAQGGPTEGLARGGERGDDQELELGRAAVGPFTGHDEVEIGFAVGGGDEPEGEGVGWGGGAMLDGERQGALLSAQIEVGITPGVEIAGAAKILACLPAAAILACVVDDEDGEIEVALQGTQVAEHGGDLSGVVLVDAVQAHEGIEDEQPRCGAAHGAGQSVLIA